MLSNFTLNSKVLNFGYAMKNINKGSIALEISLLQEEMASCGIPAEQYAVETPNGCKKEQMLNEYKRIATVYMEFLQSSNEQSDVKQVEEAPVQEPEPQVEEQSKKAKKEPKSVVKEPKAKKQSKGEAAPKQGRLDDANARLDKYTLELEQRSAMVPEGETERQNNKRIASLKRKIARATATIEKNSPVVK